MEGYKISYICLDSGPGMAPVTIWSDMNIGGGVNVIVNGISVPKRCNDIKQPFEDKHAYDIYFNDGSVTRLTNQVIEVVFRKE